MIRLAAESGLTPAEFFELTPREFELWLEGYRARVDRATELLAWTQANLINVHVPRGKPRMTIEKLLPRGKKRRDRKDADEDQILAVQQALASDPAEAARLRLEAKKKRIRAAEEEREADTFWKSAEGRRVRELLGEEG